MAENLVAIPTQINMGRTPSQGSQKSKINMAGGNNCDTHCPFIKSNQSFRTGCDFIQPVMKKHVQ